MHDGDPEQRVQRSESGLRIDQGCSMKLKNLGHIPLPWADALGNDFAVFDISLKAGFDE
jgi:hypothetical protein